MECIEDICTLPCSIKSCEGRWTKSFKYMGSTGAGVGESRQGKLARFVF